MAYTHITWFPSHPGIHGPGDITIPKSTRDHHPLNATIRNKIRVPRPCQKKNQTGLPLKIFSDVATKNSSPSSSQKIYQKMIIKQKCDFFEFIK